MARQGLFDFELNKRSIFDPEDGSPGVLDPDLPLPPSNVPALSWHPTYPDFASGAQPLVAEGGVTRALSPAFPIPVGAWRGVYPSEAPGARPLVPEGWMIPRPFSPAYPIPNESWKGTWADTAPGPQQPNPEGKFAWSNSTPIGTPLSWQTKYADLAPGRPPLVPEGKVNWAISSPLTTLMDWQPEFPDIARGATPLVPEGRVNLTIESPLTTLLDWQPEFADFANAKTPLVPEGYRTNTPLVSAAPVTVSGTMPGAVPVTVSTTQYQSVAAPVKLPAGQTPLTWQPEFADLAPGALRNSLEGWFAEPESPAFPVPTLAWRGNWPDSAWATPPTWAMPEAFYPLPLPLPVNQLGWRGVYADFAPSAIPVREGYFARTAYVPLVTPLIWQPTYQSLMLPIPQTWTRSDIFFNWEPLRTASPLLAWRGTWADQILTALPLVPEGKFALQTSSPLPVPSLSWHGFYPDVAPGAQPLTDKQLFALNPLPITVALPPLTWQPRYPDYVTTLPYLGTMWAEQEQYHFAVVIIVPTFDSWHQPSNYLPPTPALNVGASVMNTLPIPAVQAPTLSWLGRWDDMAPAARPLADWLTTAQNTLPIALPVNQLGWRGSYPDWFQYLRPADFMAFTTGADSPVFPIPTLSWQGRWADRAPGWQPLADWQTTAMNILPLPLPVVQMGWRGGYPDWFVYLRPADFPAFTTGSTSSTFPVSTLSWRPRFPDFAEVAKGVIAPPFFANDNVPRAGVPVMSWQPTFPDFAPAAARLLEALQQALATGVIPNEFRVPGVMSWLSRYADLAPGARPLVEWSLYTWSEYELFRPPSPVRAWAPTFPDFARAPLPLPMGAYQFGAGTKPLFFPGPEIIRFMVEQAGRPAFILEVSFEPRASNEIAGKPGFTGEGSE